MKPSYQFFYAAFFIIFCSFGCGMDSEYDLKDVSTQEVGTYQDQNENPAVIPAYRPNDDVQLQSNFQNNQDNTAFRTCRGKSANRLVAEPRRVQLFVDCYMIDGRLVGSNSISAEWGLNNDGDIAAFSSQFPRPILDCGFSLLGGFGSPIIFTALCEDINGNFQINTFELVGTNIDGLIINNRLVRK